MLDVTQDTELIALDIRGWRITTERRPISNAKEIESLQTALDIPMPEMIFGNNVVRVACPALGIDLAWSAHEALDQVDKHGTKLKVVYSEHWNKTRDQHSEDIKHVTKPYDWTYTTAYAGSCEQCTWQETEEGLPMALLKRQDPILLYDEVVLYEDELADNGTSLFSIRVRVMPDRLLVLARFFLRLDGVLFRIRDTRLFCELADGKVLREYVSREEEFDKVKAQIPPYQQDEAGTLLDDANWVLERCPIVERRMETLKASKTA
ncbi:TIP41-like family-domain-containing protein [Protomyces lactucae-debilis]|uniref:TIP41-like family-domain-containing protein n=1 Tax=Protomyces lactucae-debilis TaxID=2754530 RepID=A0A1Y2FP77_PROLT|nr:TIP41-like family-domain-containing protein [Protomyces lactucae-debilis]ORY85006.1 TIP41-like family-domain-containing protein [Protomyces lactucae-debilis]